MAEPQELAEKLVPFGLVDLLRREGRHSGVWFADKLLLAADTIERLAALRASQQPSGDGCRYIGVDGECAIHGFADCEPTPAPASGLSVGEGKPFNMALARKLVASERHQLPPWLQSAALDEIDRLAALSGPAETPVASGEVEELIERLRVIMVSQPDSGKRETYSDGYAMGLCTAIHELRALAQEASRG